MKKRILALFLATAMSISSLEVTALAADPSDPHTEYQEVEADPVYTELSTEQITEAATEEIDDFADVITETELSTETSSSEMSPETSDEESINKTGQSVFESKSGTVETAASIGDTFDTKFGTYKVLSIGENPTAALVGNPYNDSAGNFVYGNSSRPWTAKYEGVDYAVTEIDCYITGTGSAKIPEGVVYIHNGSFKQSFIETIELPSTLKYFDEQCSLYNLESISISNENPYYTVVDGALLTKDGKRLLLYPAKLNMDSYTTPQSVTQIREAAFFNNAYLKTINLTNVESIENYVFYQMKKIETINYPKTLTSYSTMGVIYQCPTLQRINVEYGNPMLSDIDGVLYCKTDIDYTLISYPSSYNSDTYIIPYGVKSICQYAFSGTTTTSTIYIPNTIQVVYSYAFHETLTPMDVILQFTSKKNMSQSSFSRLSRGSKIYVDSEDIRNNLPEDMITTRTDESGGTQIDKETPIIVDYEKAVSRIENWYLNSGKKYYYDTTGSLASGLQDIQGKQYYFDTNNNEMLTGFQDIGDKTFYFLPNSGEMSTGTGIVIIDNAKYYINPDYSIYKGHELHYDNRIYYLNTNTGEIICDSLSHNYGAWEELAAPSCTSDGSHRHTCKKCNYAETIAISKIPHQFGAWTTISAASCTKEGEQIHKCSLCGTTEKAPIAKLSHQPGTWVVAKQSTCISNGEKVLKCAVCSQVLQTMTIPKTTHKYGSWKIQRKATYSSTGIRVRSCSVCGATETSVIPKLIKKDIGRSTVSSIKQRTYNGKSQSPSVCIKYNGKSLKKNVDYSISYRNNKKPGKATIRLTGKGAFEGSKSVSFYISPKAPSIKSLKSTKKRTMDISIKKTNGASGYQIFYSTKKSFKSAKYVTSTRMSKTVTKLSSKKSYYVKVRAYKKYGGKKIYSTYCKIRKIKIK